MKTTLADLGLHAQGGKNPVVTSLTTDSREVTQGALFCALPGTKVHGATFAGKVIADGAAAILTDAAGAAMIAEANAGEYVAVIVAEDPRQTLAQTAALWFGRQPETVVAVTGTNGKTSVSSFCRQIWAEMGYVAANLGTTGVEGAFTAPLHHTTPDPITLHRVMAEAAAAGVTHLSMEASSHGLDQRRLDGVLLKAGGFTNFTQDHLDYHKTFSAYLEAKLGLFTRVLSPEAVAVINMDDPKGVTVSFVADDRGLRTIGVGRSDAADLRLMSQRFDATGQDIRFTFRGKRYQTRLNLVGGFQADNVLLAAGLVVGAGDDPDAVFETFPHLRTVRGRMELAATRDNGAAVFVDYAHTPDAIQTALRALRPHVMGRIIAIVGAGGDRDTTKRPLMGAAAVENADVVIVTDDNPRSEVPAAIRAAVLEGARSAGGADRVTEVGDRAEAILRGVDMLEPGDALLICGKGHETGQVVGGQVLPFDDVEQASISVAALEGRI